MAPQTEQCRLLRHQLASLLEGDDVPPPQLTAPSIDVIVNHNEVNRRHGTGALIQKLFAGCDGIVTLRALDTYGGEQDFGIAQFCLPRLGMPRQQIFAQVREWLDGTSVRRVALIPYGADDVQLALAVKEIFGAPLCLYIMDDNNVCQPGIPDGLMAEAVEKARLCFTISPEMQYAYQNKFRRKVWVLPPLVNEEFLRERRPLAAHSDSSRGVMVGNIWSQRWLELLRRTVREAGVEVDWYCHNKRPPWLNFEERELEWDGIHQCDAPSDALLANRLRTYRFAVIPSGSLDDMDNRKGVAELSLPSRIPFILAAAQIPMIVMGKPRVAAAQFVERFGVGAVCGYDAEDFRRAIAEVTPPEAQQRIRENAWRIAPRFSDSGMGEWLWRSLELGEPCDRRFEDLMPVRPGTFLYYQDPPPPPGAPAGTAPLYQTLRRLKRIGFDPDFIVDLGRPVSLAHAAATLFPEARFVADAAAASPVKLPGRGLVKAGAESVAHLLAGWREFLEAHIDVAVLEADIGQSGGDRPTFAGLLAAMSALGFEYFDDAAKERDSVTGRLCRSQPVFVSRGWRSQHLEAAC